MENEWSKKSYAPWNEGGKEEVLARRNITMTHDELALELGESYKKIIDAGFVIIPKSLRDDWFESVRNK
jgi:hypothetical protein